MKTSRKSARFRAG